MRKILCLVLISAGLMACETKPEPPPPADAPRVEAPPLAGEDLLVMVNRCAKELFPESVGVGGNRLRYDSLSLRPYEHHFGENGGIYELPEVYTTGWRVRIEEEHPHTSIPNGVEFSVHSRTGACGRSAMD